MIKISLQEISSSILDNQLFLYDILKYRWSISNTVNINEKCRSDLPSFEEHIKTINSDEYKKFFKIKFGDIDIGLILLKKNNENATFISPNLLKNALKKYKNEKKETDFIQLCALVHLRFGEMLPEVETHYARVNPQNKLSLKNLLENGYEIIEYVLALKAKNGKPIQGKWIGYEPI